MMALLSRAFRRIAFTAAAAALLAHTGCKPAVTPPADHTHDPSDNNTTERAPHQPNAGDLDAFFKTLLPPVVKLTHLQTDEPTRMPNTSPDSRVWLINAKITLTPGEDLLAIPSPEDTHAIDSMVNDLNTLIAWSNAYARSPYEHFYGAFEVVPPVSPVPQLLVVRQPKDRPMAPIYGKIAAEWQVDHWQFSNVDMELPQMGQPVSAFTGGPTMVKNSSEAEAFLTAERKAIKEAKQKQSAIENSYSKDLLAAVRPGTVYTGKISHRLGVLPCELRFLEQPQGDTQTAIFEVRLTSEPSYQFVYTVKLVTPLPIGVSASSTNGESFRISDDSTSAPTGNLIVNFSRGSGGGKEEDGKTLPGMVLRGQKGRYTANDQPFVLVGGRIEGVVSNYANDKFRLIAQKKP